MVRPIRITRADSGTGLHPSNLINSALAWISGVIVMGILSYQIHRQRPFVSSHMIYEEVIAVLTVAFFVFRFLLGRLRHYHMLFNLVFSYLWLVSVVFTAMDWSRDRGTPLDHTVEAFSFIAFFFLFGNVIWDWYVGCMGDAGHITSSVV